MQSYQAPAHFGSPGDLSWNQGTSNVPLIATGLNVKVIELDPPGGVYFYEIEAPGDFSGLGFRPGMRIEVGGFTDPDNNGVKHIATLYNSNRWMVVRETGLSEEDDGGDYVAGVRMSFVPTPAVGWVCENGKWTTFGDVSHGTFHVRGVVIDDVADLEAFAAVSGGTPIDGVTYAQGDRVLLANQTAAEENGVYIVGLVDAVAGEAPLTRAPDLPDGVLFTAGAVFEVLKGDRFALTTWKAVTDGPIIVGTNGFAIYPRSVQGTLDLTDGEETIACPILDGTKTMVTLTRTTFDTANDTLEYAVTSRSQGIAGSFGVRACLANNGANTDDESTLSWLVTNW